MGTKMVELWSIDDDCAAVVLALLFGVLTSNIFCRFSNFVFK